jgi:hypothetical protein
MPPRLAASPSFGSLSVGGLNPYRRCMQVLTTAPRLPPHRWMGSTRRAARSGWMDTRGARSYRAPARSYRATGAAESPRASSRAPSRCAFFALSARPACSLTGESDEVEKGPEINPADPKVAELCNHMAQASSHHACAKDGY